LAYLIDVDSKKFVLKPPGKIDETEILKCFSSSFNPSLKPSRANLTAL